MLKSRDWPEIDHEIEEALRANGDVDTVMQLVLRASELARHCAESRTDDSGLHLSAIARELHDCAERVGGVCHAW